MLRPQAALVLVLLLLCSAAPAVKDPAPQPRGLRLGWADDWLTISGEGVPGREIRVHYLEAYCRPGSTDRDWHETTIGHKTELVSAVGDGKRVVLRSTLADGAVVDHVITAKDDEVDFALTAHNPTDKPSAAHWAQPCVRLDKFTGGDKDTYLRKCFIFLGGELRRMPTEHWATKARYTPGQVWCPKNVDRNDVNPRPLSGDVPSNGLIGCYSADEKTIFATAWEPYQELFQGVAACLHSDFRIGGLKPGETKKIRGKIYVVPADVPALLRRYRADFPEHQASTTPCVGVNNDIPGSTSTQPTQEVVEACFEGGTGVRRGRGR